MPRKTGNAPAMSARFTSEVRLSMMAHTCACYCALYEGSAEEASPPTDELAQHTAKSSSLSLL
jgi:hypothetical protein